MKNQTDEPMGGLGAQIMMASELGSAIVVLTVAGYFAGAWMDGRFQSSPYGVIVGISVGFGLGIAFVIKRSNDMDKKRWTSLGWRWLALPIFCSRIQSFCWRQFGQSLSAIIWGVFSLTERRNLAA